MHIYSYLLLPEPSVMTTATEWQLNHSNNITYLLHGAESFLRS